MNDTALVCLVLAVALSLAWIVYRASKRAEARRVRREVAEYAARFDAIVAELHLNKEDS